MGEGLLPCPFCGSEAGLKKLLYSADYPWFIEVKHRRDCEIALTDHSSRLSHRTRAAATKRWNTRAQQEKR